MRISSSLIAVGDTTAAELVAELEKVLAGWQAPTAAPAVAPLPTPVAAQTTRVLLVDKPGAAQSVISVSQVGPARNSPDYYALSVMNSIFGGQFSSRLNLNLRETKGYTYGARSAFDWRIRQPGPYVASASVQTAVTAPALVEFLKEYQGLVAARPAEAQEVDFSKMYLIRGFPADFETPGQVARSLEALVEYGLPDDFFNTYLPRIQAVSPSDVQSVAKKYVDLEHLAIIIVADRAKVEASLRELPVGKDLETVQFDENFQLLPAK